MLIFLKGVITLPLVTTSLNDLGIQNPGEENYICELYQDCRHVFFLPLFPLRTYWIIKNSKEEEVSDYDVLKRIKSIENQFRVRKNVSWLGLIVLILVLFLPVGLLYFDEWSIKNERTNEAQANYEAHINLLNSPSSSHYYNLFMDSTESKEAGYYCFKVNRVKKDSIQLILLYDNYVHGGYDKYSKKALVDMTIKGKVYNSFWIKRENLMKIFLSSNSNSQTPVAISVMDENHKKLTLLGVNNIAVVEGPAFNTVDHHPGQTNYMIVNEGFDTRIDSVEVRTKDSQWKVPTGIIIHNEESFPISFTGKGKAYLHCSDSLGSYKIDLSSETDFLQIDGYPIVY